jgi:predicted nucleic acid-binding protein
MIVADTNIISYLLIDGEHTRTARAVWAKDRRWIVPPLWRSEFLSVLAVAVRHSVLDETQAVRAWRNALRLLGRSEREPGGETVLALAIRHGISAYDAHFVALAHAGSVVLVTGDKKLRRACKDVAVSAEEFVKRG